MSKKRSYHLNRETLTYEYSKTPFSKRFLKALLYLGGSIGMFIFYLYLYVDVLGFETPKTIILKRAQSDWHSKLELVNTKLDEDNKLLMELQMRDSIVYRPIFGMEELPSDVRMAGFGGTDRYSQFELIDHTGKLTETIKKLDILNKRAYIQSRSLDDVSNLAKMTKEMSQCVPSISPVSTDKRHNHLSSSFGVRVDPFTGKYKFHSGVDITGRASVEPVYTTGDGVVQTIGFDYFGYGNYVIVNHGFGYKTRYAHLKTTNVIEGQKIKKGDQIATMGNTGRSKGKHLHYEVIYKNKTVNPLNYFNFDILPEDYALMVNQVKPRG